MSERQPSDLSKEIIPYQPEPGEGSAAVMAAILTTITACCSGTGLAWWITNNPEKVQNFLNNAGNILRSLY